MITEYRLFPGLGGECFVPGDAYNFSIEPQRKKVLGMGRI